MENTAEMHEGFYHTIRGEISYITGAMMIFQVVISSKNIYAMFSSAEFAAAALSIQMVFYALAFVGPFLDLIAGIILITRTMKFKPHWWCMFTAAKCTAALIVCWRHIPAGQETICMIVITIFYWWASTVLYRQYRNYRRKAYHNGY